MNHLNGNNHQTQASNYGRTYYDEASTTAKLEYQLRETEQLLEISLLKKKLRETERAMEQIIADIHGKAAKCNVDDNNASNRNGNTTVDEPTTQVRSSKLLFKKKSSHTHTKQNKKPKKKKPKPITVAQCNRYPFRSSAGINLLIKHAIVVVSLLIVQPH